MAITETRNPYEVLHRWDEKTGAYKGTHIQYYDLVLKDGVQIAGAASKAYGVGEGLAFPLADVMDTVTASALARVDELTAALALAEADRDTALAQVADLQAQVDAQQPVIAGIPQEISKKQGRAQLKLEGLLDAVEGYILSLPRDDDTRMAYEDAATWVRTDPTVLGMMRMLGKTDLEADAFFLAAANAGRADLDTKEEVQTALLAAEAEQAPAKVSWLRALLARFGF